MSLTKRGMTIDEVERKIKEMICYNHLAPGQKIIYNDLAKKLDITATPLIQSLKRLENARIVDYIPNKGYFVSEITVKEAEQLHNAREALEVYIVPAVIKNMTTKKLEEIRGDFKKYEKNSNRVLNIIDGQFHLKIVEQADNDVISQSLHDIFERIYLKYRPHYMEIDHEKVVLRDHHEILETIKRKDVTGTIVAIQQHIRRGMDYVVRNLIEGRKILR